MKHLESLYNCSFKFSEKSRQGIDAVFTLESQAVIIFFLKNAFLFVGCKHYGIKWKLSRMWDSPKNYKLYDTGNY